MAFEKVDKRFVLSDSTENVYGYKLLTSGYMMNEFLKNPIGYYMHKKDDGVLVKWEDIQLDGDQILGTPCINLEHPRGARTVKEINDGFLNAASVGKLVFVDFELADSSTGDEPDLIVTKWYNRECSLVDNPANRNAIKVELADADGNDLNLSDITDLLKIKKNSMKKITLPVSPELLQLLNLSDEGATAEAVMEGIKGLSDENATLKTEQTTLTDAKKKAEKDLADLQEQTLGKELATILDKGVKDGKITVKAKDKLAKQYDGKPKDLADLLEDMPVYQPLDGRINVLPDVVKDLADKDFDYMDKNNKVELVKKHAPELYNQKFKEKFGYLPGEAPKRK